MFGRRRLDAIKSEDVQRLKAQLEVKSPKTVNNVLNVLSVLLKRAVEWDVIERMRCTVKLLRVDTGTAAFHDFDDYERFVDVAQSIDIRTLLVVLLGGDAGLRCGEIIGLEWADVDLAKRQLCVRQSDWNGQLGTPKSGRLRYVPLTQRLTAALVEHRHLRSSVVCQTDGSPFTRQIVQNRMILAARRANVRRGRAHPASHVLLALVDARCAGEGDSGARRARRPDDDAAVHAPEPGRARRGDRATGAAVRRSKLWRYVGNGGPAAKTITESGATSPPSRCALRWTTFAGSVSSLACQP